MRSTVSVMGLLGLMSVFCLKASADHFEYNGLADTTGLAFNGDSAALDNGVDGAVIRIAPARDYARGSVFYDTPVHVAQFSTYFEFRISNAGGFGDGSDGLAFVLHADPDGPFALGGYGGAHYLDIIPCVAVEFDTELNASLNDPNGNHLGINVNGPDHGLGYPYTADPGTSLQDGSKWYVWVDYDGAAVDLRASQAAVRPGGPLLHRELDLSQILGQETAFVGFTSGTGTQWGDHDVLAWQYSSPIPEPSTWTLLSIAFACLVACRARGLSRKPV